MSVTFLTAIVAKVLRRREENTGLVDRKIRAAADVAYQPPEVVRKLATPVDDHVAADERKQKDSQHEGNPPGKKG